MSRKIGGSSHSLVAVAAATTISLIAAVASASITGGESGPDVVFGVTVGLLTEALGLTLALWVRLAEAQHELATQLSDSSVLMQLASRVAASDEPIVTERYQRLLQEMKELAEGRYELRSLEAVYDDDQRTIELMRNHEILRSICPLARTSEDIELQLSNRSFIASSRAHKRARERGVHIIRIFIFVDEAHLKLPSVESHLRELKKAGLDCRYIFRNNQAYQEAKMIDPDFVIFGEHKVSIGTIDPATGTVNGAHVRFDHETIATYIRDFDKLERISQKFESFEEEDRAG